MVMELLSKFGASSETGAMVLECTSFPCASNVASAAVGRPSCCNCMPTGTNAIVVELFIFSVELFGFDNLVGLEIGSKPPVVFLMTLPLLLSLIPLALSSVVCFEPDVEFKTGTSTVAAALELLFCPLSGTGSDTGAIVVELFVAPILLPSLSALMAGADALVLVSDAFLPDSGAIVMELVFFPLSLDSNWPWLGTCLLKIG
jgi:hypothetical protein